MRVKHSRCCVTGQRGCERSEVRNLAPGNVVILQKKRKSTEILKIKKLQYMKNNDLPIFSKFVDECFYRTVTGSLSQLVAWPVVSIWYFLFSLFLDSLLIITPLCPEKQEAFPPALSLLERSKIWSDLVSNGLYWGEAEAQLLFSAFTQHVFSLRLALPICEQHSGSTSTRAVTGPIS